MIRLYDYGALTNVLMHPSSSQSSWHWCRDGVNRLRVVGRLPATGADSDALRLPPTRALLKSVTADPRFLHRARLRAAVARAGSTSFTIGALLAAGAFVFVWMKSTIRQMFLLEVDTLSPLPQVDFDTDTPLNDNLILLVVDRVRASEVIRARHDAFPIDVVEVVSGTAPSYEHVAQPVIAIDHFDDRNDDAEANGKKLNLLEQLRALHPQKHIVIVTAIDPVFFFDPDADLGAARSREMLAPGHEIYRWANVLAGFMRLRVADLPQIIPARRDA